MTTTRERPASERTELARVAVLALGITTPFAVGVAVGDRPPELPLEPRYAAVIGVACLASLAVLGESTGPRGRRACAALALVPLLHFAVASSPWIAALDVLVLLASSAGLVGRAVQRIVKLPVTRARRAAAVGTLALAALGPHVTLGWGLVSTTLAPALVRLFHQSPEIGPGEQAVAFPSRDGIVIRGTFAPGAEGAPAILLVHGVADSRWRLIPWARELSSHGAHVLRIDLRGHGTSDGVAVTFADREPDDVEAAMRWLAARPGVGALHVLGVSMGGGAVLAAVSRRSVAVESTVALAPASDYQPMVDGRLPPFEPFHSLARAVIRGVTHGLGHRSPLELTPAAAVERAGEARILVIHSRSDATVPPEVSESLLRRAPWVEVVWIDGVSHVQMPAHTLETQALRERIEAFLGVDVTGADRR